MLTTHSERMYLAPEAEFLREYLGAAEDLIDCPTPAQRELFGPRRRRVPQMMDMKNPVLLGPVQNQEHHMNGVVARRNNFNEQILPMLEEAYADFGRLTGRTYGLLTEFKTDDADTVFVSLGCAADNIEAACDYIVVIRFGQLMFAGPIDELMARTRAHIDVTAELAADHDRLAAYLEGAGWSVQRVEGRLRVAAGQSSGAAINRSAAGIGITLSSLTFAQDSLEDIFLAMTGTTDGELAADRAAAAMGEVA